MTTQTQTIRLGNADSRARAARWCAEASDGVVVTFQKGEKRSTDANAAMWAMLGKIAEHATLPVLEDKSWVERRLSPEEWKSVFYVALDKESKVVRGVDGTPVELRRTSKLTKREFSDLLELIQSYAARKGIEL